MSRRSNIFFGTNPSRTCGGKHPQDKPHRIQHTLPLQPGRHSPTHSGSVTEAILPSSAESVTTPSQFASTAHCKPGWVWVCRGGIVGRARAGVTKGTKTQRVHHSPRTAPSGFFRGSSPMTQLNWRKAAPLQKERNPAAQPRGGRRQHHSKEGWKKARPPTREEGECNTLRKEERGEKAAPARSRSEESKPYICRERKQNEMMMT